jgi:excinuclease ABC subunit C
MDKFKIINVKNIESLPKNAGVYAFYTKNDKRSELLLIYIGKAINIKNRVKNHFSSPTYKDSAYMNQIEKIGFIETGNEIQALILEAKAIKKNQPKFNQIWRDDKNYFFIAIVQNKQKIPYLFITHQPHENSKLIGPFVDGNALKKTMRFLRKVFPYYTTSKHSKLKCTYCHLDLCPGPNPNIKEYKTNIKKLILVLQGKSTKVLNSLKKEMKLASMEQNFEKAGKLRDQIFALEKIMSHKTAENKINYSNNWKATQKYLQDTINYKNQISKIECYDVSNIQGKFAVASMVVFVDGKSQKNQYKKFRIKMKNEPNDIAMLKEVLQRRFIHTEWEYPEIILIDGGKAQLNIAINSKPQNSNIRIISIAKGRQELFIENHPPSSKTSARQRKNPIPLKELPQEIYNLIKNLDDEAHRFAITYHKKLRKNNLLNNF